MAPFPKSTRVCLGNAHPDELFINYLDAHGIRVEFLDEEIMEIR